MSPSTILPTTTTTTVEVTEPVVTTSTSLTLPDPTTTTKVVQVHGPHLRHDGYGSLGQPHLSPDGHTLAFVAYR